MNKSIEVTDKYRGLKVDILYIGVNMGNAGYRFFRRYPDAEDDYYMGFIWLVRLKTEYPQLNIYIKHHGGDYDYTKDTKELFITNNHISYLPSKDNTYYYASLSKLCVSYCSTMIMELNNMPNISKYIYRHRHYKYQIQKPCKGHENIPIINTPSYFLDPNFRNKQFCSYIDDCNIHDCSRCDNPPWIEIYEPYRITKYEDFKEIMLRTLDKTK